MLFCIFFSFFHSLYLFFSSLYPIFFFFFNDTATTEIYTLSLHDALPIFQTSTYAQEGVGKPKRYDYARGGNPTREALQTVLASLEGGAHGLSFSSGMGAETTLLMLLKPGDHVLLADDVYGGTYRLLARVLADWGIAFDTVDMTNLDAFRAGVRDSTRMVWVETPSNPLLKVVDLARAADIAHEAGAWCVVDNTFATPYLQRPLDLGCDVVVHSE